MLINTKKTIGIFISIIFLAIITSIYTIFDFNQSLVSGLNQLTLICVITYIWILISSYRLSNKVNIYFILIILTIPFYLGDQLSLWLGYKNLMLKSDHSIIDGIIPNQDIFQAMFLLIWSLLFLHIGYIISYKIKKDNSIEDNSYYSTQMRSMRTIGMIMFALTVIPAIIARFHDIHMTMILGGHLQYRLNGGSTNGFFYYMDYFADYFIPSCLILLIFCENKMERKVSITSIIIYSILYLLSGSRIEIIGFLFATVCIYIYWYRVNFTKRKVIKYCLLGVMLIVLFEIVGNSRNSSGGLDMFTTDGLLDNIGGIFLYKIFETTGNTFTSIANTVRCVPKVVPFNYGKSVIGSLIYILPSFLRGNYLNTITTHISALLSPYYYGWKISGYGSSFITEAFFNYGYFCLIVILIYGIIIGKIINLLEKPNKQKPFRFYFVVYMVLEISTAIRNDLYFIPRHLMLYVFIPYVLSLYFCRRKVKMNKNK